MKRIFFITLLSVIIFFSFNTSISAQTKTTTGEPPKEESLEATIKNILEEKQIKPMGSKKLQLYQKLELLITKGSLKDKKIIIENGKLPMANISEYEVNDKVIVTFIKDFEGNDNFYITDYIRHGSLIWLLLIFIAFTVIVAKWRGITSLVGMGISFLVIFLFILPKILEGSNPVEIAILGSLVIIPISFFLSHGFNKKTLVAIIGTLIALIATGFLATLFVEAAKLTGFASEEAGFLQATKQEVINMRGLLLAGIIIGALGVLDDITISQSAIVFQLKKANEKLKLDELYEKAMNVGQDHVSSMVNTLILVYTGASLPLLLLFVNNPHPFSEIINYEIIATEVVRTLVGSIGLILAVPITTVIASLVATQKKGK